MNQNRAKHNMFKILDKNIFILKMLSLFLIAIFVSFSENLYAQMAKLNDRSMLSPPEIPTQVKIGVNLISIHKIDKQIHQQPKLTLQINLQTVWQDKRIKKYNNIIPRSVNVYYNKSANDIMQSIWTPNIIVPNAVDWNVLNSKLYVYASGMFKLRQEIEVVVPLDFNLQLFPFDSQKISIVFVPRDQSIKEVTLTEDLLFSEYNYNVISTEWKLDFVLTMISSLNNKRNGIKQSSLAMVLYLKRIPSFYMYRLFLPLLFIITAFFLSALVTDDNIGRKLQRAVVFLLTIVAFHSLGASFLPNINYLTFIDTIVMLSYILILAYIVEVVLVHKLKKSNKAKLADKIDSTILIYAPFMFFVSLIVIILYFFMSY